MKFKKNDIAYKVTKKLFKTKYDVVRIIEVYDKNDSNNNTPNIFCTIQYGTDPLIVPRNDQSYWFPEYHESQLISEKEYRKLKLKKINEKSCLKENL